MVVVAHRLATIQRADIIFVMHEGRIVERGDHQSLLASRGWYWQMVSQIPFRTMASAYLRIVSSSSYAMNSPVRQGIALFHLRGGPVKLS